MSELAQLSAKVDRVLQLLEARPQPHLTRRQFAQRIGKHPNTVGRWIVSRKIITEKGGIPASELKKFTSF